MLNFYKTKLIQCVFSFVTACFCLQLFLTTRLHKTAWGRHH